MDASESTAIDSPSAEVVDADTTKRLLVGRVLLAKRDTDQRVRAARLEHELARMTQRSFEREWQLLEFHNASAEFAPEGPFAAALERVLGIEFQGPAAPPQALSEPAQITPPEIERGRLIARTVTALLQAEGIGGMQLLEAGVPCAMLEASDGPTFGTGPVVFRRVDDRGRLIGSLEAERLWLDGSLAGRSLTLVLEHGAEHTHSEVVPFADDELRIPLRYVDPAPFLELCPELFEPDARAEFVPIDGASRAELLVKLARMLDASSLGARYEVEDFATIVDGVWRDVRVRVRASDGDNDRYLLADQMRFAVNDGLVSLELRDGVSMRGDRKAPFLDGRMRIVLPRADPARWRAARLPGFPAAEAPAIRPESDDLQR